MPKTDMSAQAITTRLKRVEQLRRLGLSLKKAKIKKQDATLANDSRNERKTN